jgi:DNA-binding beta-propeller fold protein YncE
MKNRVGVHARLKQGGAVLGAAVLAVLAGCGSSSGGSSSSTVANSFINAALVLGQTSATGFKPNQGGLVSEKTLSNPTGSVATNGTLFYVADTNNNRILGYNNIPTSTDQAADFVIGQDDLNTGGASPTSLTTLSYPTKVSISDDTIPKLVVADSGNNRVLIWNTLPTSNAAPNVVVGQANFTSGKPNRNGSPTAATLSNPTAAMIANGQLFVVDSLNNRLLIWNSVPGSNGASADVWWGQPAATTNVPNCGAGDSGSATCNQSSYPISEFSLFQPEDLWTDGHKLFVADSSNNRVLFWTQIPVANTVSATFVMGQSVFNSGVTGGTSANLMNGPYSVASDGGRVFVADTTNNRVLVFETFPTINGPNADTVFGQNNFSRKTANDDNQNSSPDSHPTARTLNHPTGVFVSSGSNDVYVTDLGNNRVLLFNPK